MASRDDQRGTALALALVVGSALVLIAYASISAPPRRVRARFFAGTEALGTPLVTALTTSAFNLAHERAIRQWLSTRNRQAASAELETCLELTDAAHVAVQTITRGKVRTYVDGKLISDGSAGAANERATHGVVLPLWAGSHHIRVVWQGIPKDGWLSLRVGLGGSIPEVLSAPMLSAPSNLAERPCPDTQAGPAR